MELSNLTQKELGFTADESSCRCYTGLRSKGTC